MVAQGNPAGRVNRAFFAAVVTVRHARARTDRAGIGPFSAREEDGWPHGI